MCRHKTMHIFSKRNKTLKKIKVEKKKKNRHKHNLKSLSSTVRNRRLELYGELDPLRLAHTQRQGKHACVETQHQLRTTINIYWTAPLQLHHTQPHPPRREREREWKEKRTFVVKMKKKIQQSNIKSKQAGFTFTDTQWDLQCDASVLCLKECELSNQLNKAKDPSS